jgi:hypothetical protein
MVLAARQCGAYGGEYLRVGLCLRARGGKRNTKKLGKLEQKEATGEQQIARRLIKIIIAANALASYL